MFEPMDFLESCQVKEALSQALDAMSHHGTDVEAMEKISKLHAHACLANAEAFREHERQQKAERAKREEAKQK